MKALRMYEQGYGGKDGFPLIKKAFLFSAVALCDQVAV